MAYAQLTDVKSRAGALASAWGQSTAPADADIEKFLEQVAGELDAFMGASGVAVPVADPIAVSSLSGVNADKALLLAIDGTWPGGTGDVAALRQQVADRVAAYDQAIADSKLSALLYLSAQASAQASGGASDFWTHDAGTYVFWEQFADRLSTSYGSYGRLDPWGTPRSAGPQFTKDMRL